MLHIPARSPDLNPVEKYWAWLRRKLRFLDLDDLMKGRPPATKAKLRARVRAICASQRAKTVARNCVVGLRRVCMEVIRKRGQATRG